MGGISGVGGLNTTGLMQDNLYSGGENEGHGQLGHSLHA